MNSCFHPNSAMRLLPDISTQFRSAALLDRISITSEYTRVSVFVCCSSPSMFTNIQIGYHVAHLLVQQSCSELLLLLYKRDERWMHSCCVCLFRALTRIRPSSTQQEEYRVKAERKPLSSTSYSFIRLFLSFTNRAITCTSC